MTFEQKEDFYKIKAKILNKYGKFIGYHIQFIPGKKCHHCHGLGLHYYFDSYGSSDPDLCWHCYNGWYKRPVWNILKVVKFGSYTFHQPYKRIYEKPSITWPLKEGYFEHKPSRLNKPSYILISLVYDFKNYLVKYWNKLGTGWRIYYWLPRNYLNNIVHIMKKGKHAYPFQKKGRKYKYNNIPEYNINDDNLPF